MFRPISNFPNLNILEIVNELFPFQHLESLFNNKDIKIIFFSRLIPPIKGLG